MSMTLANRLSTIERSSSIYITMVKAVSGAYVTPA